MRHHGTSTVKDNTSYTIQKDYLGIESHQMVRLYLGSFELLIYFQARISSTLLKASFRMNVPSACISLIALIMCEPKAYT